LRRATWHSGLRQARWRLPIRGSGKYQRRQIVQGLFRERAIVILHHHSLTCGQPLPLSRVVHFWRAVLSGSLPVSIGGSFLESAEAQERFLIPKTQGCALSCYCKLRDISPESKEKMVKFSSWTRAFEETRFSSGCSSREPKLEEAGELNRSFPFDPFGSRLETNWPGRTTLPLASLKKGPIATIRF